MSFQTWMIFCGTQNNIFLKNVGSQIVLVIIDFGNREIIGNIEKHWDI